MRDKCKLRTTAIQLASDLFTVIDHVAIAALQLHLKIRIDKHFPPICTQREVGLRRHRQRYVYMSMRRLQRGRRRQRAGE